MKQKNNNKDPLKEFLKLSCKVEDLQTRKIKIEFTLRVLDSLIDEGLIDNDLIELLEKEGLTLTEDSAKDKKAIERFKKV